MATATTKNPFDQQTSTAGAEQSDGKTAATVKGEADEDWPAPVLAKKEMPSRPKAVAIPKRVRK